MIRLVFWLIGVNVARRLERASRTAARADGVAAGYLAGHAAGVELGRAMSAHPAGGQL
jgi:hypothetical protein